MPEQNRGEKEPGHPARVFDHIDGAVPQLRAAAPLFQGHLYN